MVIFILIDEKCHDGSCIYSNFYCCYFNAVNIIDLSDVKKKMYYRNARRFQKLFYLHCTVRTQNVRIPNINYIVDDVRNAVSGNAISVIVIEAVV